MAFWLVQVAFRAKVNDCWSWGTRVFLRLENKNEMVCKTIFLNNNCREKAAQSEKRIFLQSYDFYLASSWVLAAGQITRAGAAAMFSITWFIIGNKEQLWIDQRPGVWVVLRHLMSKEVGSSVIWTVLVLFNASCLGTGKWTGFADVPHMSKDTGNNTRIILKLHSVLC